MQQQNAMSFNLDIRQSPQIQFSLQCTVYLLKFYMLTAQVSQNSDILNANIFE